MKLKLISISFIFILLACKKDKLRTSFLIFENNTNQNVTAAIFNGWDSNILYKTFFIEAHSTLKADTFRMSVNKLSEVDVLQGETYFLKQAYWEGIGFYMVQVFEDGRSTIFPKDMHQATSDCDTSDYDSQRIFPCNFRTIKREFQKDAKGFQSEECRTATFYITNQDLYYAR